MRPSLFKITAAALAMLASCHAEEGLSAQEAKGIGDRFMVEHLPQVPLSQLRVEVIDKKYRWRLSYDYPSGSTGGPIVLEIDKRTGKIAEVDIAQIVL